MRVESPKGMVKVGGIVASLTRLGGGIDEVLRVGNVEVLTTRGKAFAVADEQAVKLALDGSGRFVAADAATKGLVESARAKSSADAERDAREAAQAVSEPLDGA